MAMKKLADVFGVPAPLTVEIEVHEGMSNVPAIDQNYLFDPIELKKDLEWLGPNPVRRNMIYTGHAGTGKTARVHQLAARLGLSVYSIGCSGKTRYEHLIGANALVNGSTKWCDGPLLAAWRNGGIFNPNEITRMDAGEQMRMVDQLDRAGALYVAETGESVPMHPLFRVGATGNSAGFGDESGAYAGEKVASFAFGDRFLKRRVEPMSAERETQVIKSIAPSLPDDIIKGMVDLAENVRRQFVGNGGKLRIYMSPRTLFDWALLAGKYRSMKGVKCFEESLMDVLLNGAPKADADTVLELYRNWMGEAGV